MEFPRAGLCEKCIVSWKNRFLEWFLFDMQATCINLNCMGQFLRFPRISDNFSSFFAHNFASFFCVFASDFSRFQTTFLDLFGISKFFGVSFFLIFIYSKKCFGRSCTGSSLFFSDFPRFSLNSSI